MDEVVLCKKCREDCTAHYLMCERVDGEFCPKCFEYTACGRGKHGEGCATLVFSDSRAPQEAK